MTTYADTSFIVSVYVQDGHSAAAQELMDSNPRLWFSPLHLAESFHAIARQVFYRRISPADAWISIVTSEAIKRQEYGKKHRCRKINRLCAAGLALIIERELNT